MPQNVEIKARIASPDTIHARLRALVQEPPVVLLQEDIFFHAPHRLKLRRIRPQGEAQLIVYDRPDLPGPRTSTYTIAPVAHPDALADVLARALGIQGIVRKKRWLYLYGQTRIHVDEVEGLGSFLELEVVLEPGQPEEVGMAIARRLMEQLEIHHDALIDRAYIDLLSDGDFPTSGR